MRRSGWSLACILLSSICLSGSADAAGCGPCCVDPNVRTGCPYNLSCCATWSNTPEYCGYYVGGGTQCHGEPRFTDEGTWGWDYFGAIFHRRVMLWWSHGGRYQGGAGAYKPDGPKLLEH